MCPCGCGRAVVPDKRGANIRRFATDACRHRYQSIARKLGEAMIEAGAYTIAEAVAATARLSSRATPGSEQEGSEVPR